MAKSQDYKQLYLGDAVLGSIDGCVTTFAVVASAIGANFPGIVAIVLGVASLFADGFSMAASNYEATKSRKSSATDHRALYAAVVTMLSFIFVGLLPLIPFFTNLPIKTAFIVSCVIAGATFFGIGMVKGMVLKLPTVRSGFGTFLTGGTAAIMAYSIGYLAESFLGTSVVLG